MAGGRREDTVDAGISWVGREVAVQHDAHADSARRRCPLGDCLGYRWVSRVDRLDQGKALGIGLAPEFIFGKRRPLIAALMMLPIGFRVGPDSDWGCRVLP